MAKAVDSEDLELFQDPLEPFSPLQTLLSPLIWGVELSHLAAWLSAFIVLDKTIMSGGRFDELGKFVCRRVTDLAGIKVRRHGLERLQDGAGYVFCINHVSVLDLFVVFQSIPYFHRSFQDIAHFKVPVYGGCVKVFGQLPVQRNNRALNERSFAQAVQMLQGGDSFVVFPEGHRTRDGHLGPFFPGAFRLAIRAGVPVVPMGMRGLRRICPAGDWRIRPGTIDVLFGQPLPSADLSLDDVDDLARRTRAALNAMMTDEAR